MKEREFSFSKILSYATCPEKYRLCYGNPRILPIQKPKPLALGSCLAKGFEGYRIIGTLKGASDAFQKEWLKDGKVLSIRSDPNNPKDFRTVERGLEILKDYMRQYPDENKQMIEPEVRFRLKIGEVDGVAIFLVGRIDGVFLLGKDICVVEDKSTSMLGPTYLRNLRDSLQIGLYLYAAEREGLFDIGGKKKTPKCLMNAVKVHLTEFKYDRDLAIKSRFSLEKYKDNAVNWIRRIISSEETGIFPKNDADNLTCTKYGGCEYLPLRYTEGNIRERLLKNEFKVLDGKEKK
jgi:hypothetical protein